MSYTAVEKLTRLLYVSEFECVCVCVCVCLSVRELWWWNLDPCGKWSNWKTVRPGHTAFAKSYINVLSVVRPLPPAECVLQGRAGGKEIGRRGGLREEEEEAKSSIFMRPPSVYWLTGSCTGIVGANGQEKNPEDKPRAKKISKRGQNMQLCRTCSSECQLKERISFPHFVIGPSKRSSIPGLCVCPGSPTVATV